MLDILYTLHSDAKVFKRKFKLPIVTQPSIVVNQPVVEDETFKDVNHSAYTQYLLIKTKKTENQKHWDKIKTQSLTKFSHMAIRLNDLALNPDIRNNDLRSL